MSVYPSVYTIASERRYWDIKKISTQKCFSISVLGTVKIWSRSDPIYYIRLYRQISANIQCRQYVYQTKANKVYNKKIYLISSKSVYIPRYLRYIGIYRPISVNMQCRQYGYQIKANEMYVMKKYLFLSKSIYIYIPIFKDISLNIVKLYIKVESL